MRHWSGLSRGEETARESSERSSGSDRNVSVVQADGARVSEAPVGTSLTTLSLDEIHIVQG